MPSGLRVLLIIVSTLALLYILRKIRYSKLQIEYALFWILCSLAMVIMAVFPEIIYKLTSLLGMMSPINVVLVLVIAVLLLKVFMMTIQVAQLENKVKELVQKIALDEKEHSNETDSNVKKK